MRATEDHVFVVAEYEAGDPQWQPRGNEPRTEAILQVQGSEVGRLFSTADGARHTGTLVVSLPKDHAPKTPSSRSRPMTRSSPPAWWTARA